MKNNINLADFFKLAIKLLLISICLGSDSKTSDPAEMVLTVTI